MLGKVTKVMKNLHWQKWKKWHLFCACILQNVKNFSKYEQKCCEIWMFAYFFISLQPICVRASIFVPRTR